MKKALYALTAVVVIMVLLLVPIALFPQTVLDFADYIRSDVIDRSLSVAKLKRSIEAAQTGDDDAKYLVALYHLNPREWAWDEVYEDAFGPKERQKGEDMMYDLADAGHPEALYWVYRETGDEQVWSRALHAGSQNVVREVHQRFMNNPCSDSLYAYVGILRTRLRDPAYPWRWSDGSGEQAAWIRRWKATLAKDVVTLDSVRAETCLSD